MTGFSLIDVLMRLFQKRAGVPVEGEAGSDTAAARAAAAANSAPVVEQGASGRPLWLEVSLSHLGLKEGQGAADNAELVADIRTVAHDYQHDATPWCAGWISFCLVKAGRKPSSQPLWALSYSDTKNQPVVRLPGPAVGAIAVKARNGGGHVTFVAGRTSSGALACCGGNQNDEVNVSPYLESVFLGFYWPKDAPLPEKTGINNLPIVSAAGKPVTSEA